jgi:CRISPR-associated protein Csm5
MKATERTERVELLLTTLSPVHVGTGEDFDPTGYVIEDGLLYHFDPASLGLDAADRRSLMACVSRPGDEAIRAVQRFFHERSGRCQAAARLVVPVVPGVASQYQARVGQVAQRESGGARVANRLEIERTSHHPHTGVPYLPGSSLKGSIRTAWLDALNKGRPREGRESANQLEKRLLGGGAFHTDPFRLLSVADASGAEVLAQIVFDTNHKKRPVVRDGRELPAQGPVTRRECIAPAQFAAMRCTVAIDPLAGHADPARTPDPATRLPGWRTVAAACNAYYLPRLRRELQLLEARALASPVWLQGVRALLQALGPSIESGGAALLRVGRHSGAESVTLDGVREIRIMKGRGQPSATGTEATTLWLAASQADARSDMQPFGWVLAHRAEADLTALRDWCAAQPRPDVTAARQRLHQARELARRQAQEEAAREAERRAREAEAAEAAAREQARLQTLSPQGREVEALRARLQAHAAARPQNVGGQLYQEVRKLVQQAEQGGWAAEDRSALAELLRTLVPQKIDLGGKAKEIRQAAQRLGGDA